PTMGFWRSSRPDTPASAPLMGRMRVHNRPSAPALPTTTWAGFRSTHTLGTTSPVKSSTTTVAASPPSPMPMPALLRRSTAWASAPVTAPVMVTTTMVMATRRVMRVRLVSSCRPRARAAPATPRSFNTCSSGAVTLSRARRMPASQAWTGSRRSATANAVHANGTGAICAWRARWYADGGSTFRRYTAGSGKDASERQVVIDGRRRAHRGGRGRGLVGRARSGRGTPFGVRAVQHQHLVHHHFGDVTVTAVLVLVLPVAQLALHVHLAALAQEALGDGGQAAPSHHIVPFGLFAVLP